MSNMKQLIEEMRDLEVGIKHRDSAKLQSETLKWIEHFGLFKDGFERDDFLRINTARCASYVYHYAPENVVLMVAKLVAWFFLIDDQFAEGKYRYDPDQMRIQSRIFIHGLKTGENNHREYSKFQIALTELLAEAGKTCPENWMNTFLNSLAWYLEGCAMESECRAQKRVPSLQEYRAIRRRSIGLFPCFDFIELVPGHSLSLNQRQSECYANLRLFGAELCAWGNDLLSFEKEVAVGCPCNLGVVLANESNVPISKGAHLIPKYFNQMAEFYFGLERDFSQREGSASALIHYSYGIKCWIQGHFEWIQTSQRYRDEVVPPPELFSTNKNLVLSTSA